MEVEEEEHSYDEEGKSDSDKDSERDHREDGQDFDGKLKKKYGKVLRLIVSDRPGSGRNSRPL